MIDCVVVGGPVAPWRDLGLVVNGSRIPLFGTGIEVDESAEPGMVGWALSGIDPSVSQIDGVPTVVRDVAPPTFAAHALGATHIDHVVVATDSLSRTCGAIVDVTGAVLRRVREEGEIRQGFHRVGGTGGLVVEVVERAGLPDGSAALWGFVLVVDDIEVACDTLGTGTVSQPRTAVQPGRQIATFRSAAGLGVPLALMSRDPR